MSAHFFQFDSYRDFLRERYAQLKAAKPSFSARYFARRAGIRSPSYFGLVVSGQRKLSLDYAEKFAIGLGLGKIDTECLKLAVTLEQTKDPKVRSKLAGRLHDLRKRCVDAKPMVDNHVRILSDPITLKLYLLAQSRQFQLKASWLVRQFPSRILVKDIEKRVLVLFDSGLWQRDGKGIRTLAPVLKTGDERLEDDLLNTHKNLLTAARNSLECDPSTRRVFGGRTFLCDRANMVRIQERIETFKRELEAEFENLNATTVFQLHLAFFELEKAQ